MHVYEKETACYTENHSESEIIFGTLNMLQNKNTHLEKSLTADTHIKLDLFSALGEAKCLIQSQLKEIDVLKNRISQDFGLAAPSCSMSKPFLSVHIKCE